MSDDERLRAELSFRIRTASPEEWSLFSNLWMAFNSIYRGEHGRSERARVMACIRRILRDDDAGIVLESVYASIDRILEVPPGDLILNKYDPNFRKASVRYASVYNNESETPVRRLEAVVAILYQIRCNLIHGSKDPQVDRDRMLVRESVNVLHNLLPVLERALAA